MSTNINFDDIFDSLEDDQEGVVAFAEDEASAAPENQEQSENTENIEEVSLKSQVEAALFMTNKPLTIPDLSHLLEVDLDDAEEALMELMNDYAFKADSALEIGDADGYILQVRNELKPVMDKMLPMELSQGSLKTLSVIAIKGPLLQSDLVLMRGVAVYDHIPELLAKKLVTKKREGRSYKLNVTQTFYEYFKLKGNKKELEVMMAMMGGEEISLPKRLPRQHNTGEDIFTDIARDDVVAAEDDALKVRPEEPLADDFASVGEDD